jgi:hypothetical protein
MYASLIAQGAIIIKPHRVLRLDVKYYKLSRHQADFDADVNFLTKYRRTGVVPLLAPETNASQLLIVTWAMPHQNLRDWVKKRKTVCKVAFFEDLLEAFQRLQTTIDYVDMRGNLANVGIAEMHNGRFSFCFFEGGIDCTDYKDVGPPLRLFFETLYTENRSRLLPYMPPKKMLIDNYPFLKAL